MKKIALIIGFIFVTSYGFTQTVKPEWGVNFFSFADNREYEPGQHQVPQTLIGSWLVPELGLTFDSVHHIRAGVGLQRNFGSPMKGLDQVDYVAYYYYNYAPFELYVGNFPSRALLSDYPNALLYDSITDMRLNMGGIFWKIAGQHCNFDIWLDWTGHQTEVQRESFLVGIAGKYQYKYAYGAVQSYMNHFALTSTEDPSQHIVDNGMARLCLGLSVPRNKILDSININAGVLASYTRERGDNSHFASPAGFISEVMVEKFGIGVKNTLYVGDNQMPLYTKYSGQGLYWGDPFYQNTFYNRTDFYIQLFDTDRVQARFTWSLHAAEGFLSHQQMFTLNVNLNSSQKKGHRLHNRRTLTDLFHANLLN